MEKAEIFVAHFKTDGGPCASNSPAAEERISANASSSLLACYVLLGLTRPTTLDKAAAAHRQQASLYHPDKYEHLAPEMKSLATAKMAEINAAYELIKLDIAQRTSAS
jgi:DnaJ-class molecular chaperone